MKKSQVYLSLSARSKILTITLHKEVMNSLSEIYFFVNSEKSSIYRQLLYKTWIQLMVSNKQTISKVV